MSEKDYKISNTILALGLCPIGFVLAIFAFFFFGIANAKAAEMQLPLPTRMCVDGISGENGQDITICGDGHLMSWWDEPFYSGPTNAYQMGGVQFADIYFANNIQYDILDYCRGESILIEGEIGGLFNLFEEKLITFQFIMNNNPLSCNVEMVNTSRMKYSCSGQGGGNFIIALSTPSYAHNVTYEIGYSKKINVTCDSSNGDIIINDKNNTQQIINNQNQNQQQTNEKLDNINSGLNDLNSNLTNSNVDTGSAGSFFQNFENNDHGLSAVITAPLNFIKNLANATCSNLQSEIPLLNTTISLPCMSSKIKNKFPELVTILHTIMYGLVAYYIALDIYRMVKGFKDPQSDKIEVVEL